MAVTTQLASLTVVELPGAHLAALDETDQRYRLGQLLSPRGWAKHLRLTNDDLRMFAEEQ